MAGGLRAGALRGVLWTGAGRYLVRVAGLVTLVLLGRLLAPEDFGVVALAVAFVTVLQTVAEAGFSVWLVQAEEVDDRTTSTAFWTSTAAGVVTAAALALAAAPLAALLDAPDLAPVLAALSLVLVLAGLASTPMALLTREMRFRELAVRQVVSVLLGCVVGVATALAGAGVWALVLQLLVQHASGLVLLLALSRWRPGRQWSRPLAVEMTRFGARVVGIQGLQQVRDQGEVLLIGAALGTTALGYWSVATRLLYVLLDLCLGTVATVATPTFVRMRDDVRRLAAAYGQSVGLSALVVGPALVALAVTSPQLVPLVFGERWTASGPLAAVLAVGGLATAMTFFDRSVLIARDRLDVELRLVVLVVVLHLGLVVAVGPAGLLPLAWALAARAFATWPVRALALRRVAGVPLSAQGPAVRLLAALGVAGGCAVMVRESLDLTGGWGDLLVVLALLALLVAVMCALVARDLVRDLARDVRGLRGAAGATLPRTSAEVVTV